jgi:hypothetical protein
MGLFDWIGGNKGESRRKEALARERAGDLAGAVDAFLEAELPDEAARVLLLRADAETLPERRIAFYNAAARTAATDTLRRRALARKAGLAFELLKAQGGALMKSEMAAVARDLEAAGELERAADAFALAGDAEEEVRVLTAAGAIERLEDRLRTSETEARSQRERSEILARVKDLDKTGERREALAQAARYLAAQTDDRVDHIVRAIRSRLARGPIVDLEIAGAPRRYAFGPDVTIGRGDATIVIASRAVSRRHVRVFRADAGPMVEDLATRNGTTLAGARLSSPLPIGSGVRLTLGSGVPCSLAPDLPSDPRSPIAIDVAGERFFAPLGDLHAPSFRVAFEPTGDIPFVVLYPSPGARLVLGDFEITSRVELCIGDEIRASRRGEILLRVAGAPKPPDSGGGLAALPGRGA